MTLTLEIPDDLAPHLSALLENLCHRRHHGTQRRRQSSARVDASPPRITKVALRTRPDLLGRL